MPKLSVHVYAPRRSGIAVRKSLNSFRAHITKCVNYHSSMMEAREFKELGMMVLHILCNSIWRRFKCPRLYPTSSFDALSLQGIPS